MLNDENNEGRTTDDDDGQATTTRQTHHPASTTSIRHWWSSIGDAKQWICASKNIDWVSRRIFPSTFIIFNIIYWSVYLSPPHYYCELKNAYGTDEPCFTSRDPIFKSS